MSTTIMYYKCTKEIDNQTFYGIKFLVFFNLSTNIIISSFPKERQIWTSRTRILRLNNC